MLILTGNRYGWTPLPTKIEENEYLLLYKNILIKNRHLIDYWYLLDENEIPSSYILKKRDDKYQDSNNWIIIENKIRNILQEAILETNFDDLVKNKYFISATDLEISEYLKGFSKNKENSILVINREIQEDYKSDKYFEEHKRLSKLKSKLKDIVSKDQYIDIEAKLENKDFLSSFHIQQFISCVKNKLEISIKKELSQKKLIIPGELIFQEKYLENIVKNKLGRNEEIEYIFKYINSSSSHQPLILSGESGIGKSSILAKVINKSNVVRNKALIYRFCGISKESSTSRNLLTSIMSQLNIKLSEKEKEEEDFQLDISNKLLSIQEKIIIIIDGYDQLSNNENFKWLPLTLPSNIKIVISVVNDLKYKEASQCFYKLSHIYENCYTIKDFTNKQVVNDIILTTLNSEYSRTLQSFQLEYINKIYEKVNSPIFLKIISQEIKNWSSNNKNIVLKANKEQAINNYLENLILKSYHNNFLIERFFGYIIASQYTLDEVLIYKILSEDKDLKSKLDNEFNNNIIEKIPFSIWSRFYQEITFFIKYDENSNINFFHREFIHSIEKYYTVEISNSFLTILEDMLVNTLDNNSIKQLLEIYIHAFSYQYKTHKNEFSKRIKFIMNEYENNDIIIKSIIIFINKHTREIGTSNLIENTIIYQTIRIDLLKELYEYNEKKWVKTYSHSLNELSISYSLIDRLIDAVTLSKKAFKILQAINHKENGKFLEECAGILANQSTFYSKLGMEEQSIDLNQQALSIMSASNVIQDMHAITMASLNLAKSYAKIGNLKESTDLNEKISNFIEVKYSLNNKNWKELYILSLRNSAENYYREGKITNAIFNEEKTNKILENDYYKDKDKYLENYTLSLNDLGVYYKEENLIKSVHLLEKSYIIMKEAYFNNKTRWRKDYSRIINNLSQLYSSIDRTLDAISLQQEAYVIIKEAYIQNKLSWKEQYLPVLSNLIGIYLKTGKLNDSLILLQESLEIRRDQYIKNKDTYREDYLLYLNNVAISYHEEGSVDISIFLFRELIEIIKEAYIKDKDHWIEEYMKYLSLLSTVYYRSKRILESKSLLIEYLTLLEIVYSEDKNRWVNDYIRVCDNLSQVYMKLGELDKSIVFLEKTLSIKEDIYNVDNFSGLKHYVESLDNLAVLYYRKKEYSKSLDIYIIEHKLLKKHYDENSPQFEKLIDDMGIVLLQRYDLAIV